MVRSLLCCLLFCACSGQAYADIESLRDNIGPDSTLTDGMPGGSTLHVGGIDFSTPGLVIDSPNAGLISEARFVIFARNQLLEPENDLADIYTYNMEFHVWSEGVVGGADSYDQNPRADAVGSHIKVDANTSLVSLITVQPWGNTGPPTFPNLFTTFLVTVDLSSAAVELQGGQQYVMSLLQKGPHFGTPVDGILGGFVRMSGSRATSTGEDLFREDNSALFPGYIESQLGSGFEQYAASLDLENGDHNGDDVVDGFDFLKWQRGETPRPLSSFDLAAWQLNFGETLVSAASAAVVIPEPSCLALLAVASVALPITRRRRR